MKEKKNIYLHILEFVFYSFFLFFMMMCFHMSHFVFVLKYLIMILLFLCSFLYLSIDLFIFLVMKNQAKVVSILSLILVCFALVYLIHQPFYFAFSFLLFYHFVKDALGIFLGEKIYDMKRAKQYCKLFIDFFQQSRKKLTLLRGLKNVFSDKHRRRVIREKRQGAVS